MKQLIGKEILIKRGRLQESMVIKSISKIAENIYSVTGSNSKRNMTVTMLTEEINESLIGGAF